MAKLGTAKRPAVACVQTMERAGEIMALCERHGWKVVVGIEPDKREDISDVEKLLNPNKALRDKPRAAMTGKPKRLFGISRGNHESRSITPLHLGIGSVKRSDVAQNKHSPREIPETHQR